MFLTMLSETQKKAFLSLAARFVAEDGLVERGEMGWLEGLKREMGMGEGTRAGDELPEDLFPIFDTPTSQIIATLETIRLGYVDGDFCAAEDKFAAKMVLAFGLPEELVDALDGWAARHAKLTREAVELMLGWKPDVPE